MYKNKRSILTASLAGAMAINAGIATAEDDGWNFSLAPLYLWAKAIDASASAGGKELPLELELGELRLSLFSVISTFGTPQDITTDELRIEAFFPADETTRQFFDGASAAAADC